MNVPVKTKTKSSHLAICSDQDTNMIGGLGEALRLFHIFHHGL